MKKLLCSIFTLIVVVTSASLLSACDLLFGKYVNGKSYILKDYELNLTEEFKLKNDITDDGKQADELILSSIGIFKITFANETFTFSRDEKVTLTCYFMQNGNSISVYESKDDMINNKEKTAIKLENDQLFLDFGKLCDFTDGAYLYLTFQQISDL